MGGGDRRPRTTSLPVASACYEFFEWAMAVATGSKADAFLGTQGDPWDTQWDMLLALIGSIVSQLLLARLHERQLARLFATTKIQRSL